MQEFTGLIYLIAAVCFIMALRGLSHPETARSGLMYGMAGMALAVATTLFSDVITSYIPIIAGVAVGGGIGAVIAKKIEMIEIVLYT